MDAFRPFGLVSRAHPVTSKSNPLINVIAFLVFKDNVNEWVTFACDGTGPADESKRAKFIQGWSCLNWLGGILVIVSLHIHFNKLLLRFSLVAALPLRCMVFFNKI